MVIMFRVCVMLESDGPFCCNTPFSFTGILIYWFPSCIASGQASTQLLTRQRATMCQGLGTLQVTASLDRSRCPGHCHK